ncbi:DnaJ C-terminal domain-containing protein [Flavobacterium selenitireducens]|uniref:DnaJ C-terminal domain-containing protein n=1 Tax=Flavobacterium selenitireducens TaxID=2722704 RepID=UPI00168A7B20|nr:J domain-containing protein [Flavobacterium selenitireducens]MBD3581018.1 J domain-containing protein [Flavobacterium selenitireducens]
MPFVDYYATLGLGRNASADDIKKAYRKLARKHHPDVNPGDNQANLKFQQLSEAYEVLGNEQNRRKYDTYGENWKQAESFGNARQSRQSQGSQEQGYTYSGDFGGDDFSDFFESMFGGAKGRGARQTSYKGQDYASELHLGLRDILQTHKRTLTVNSKTIRITVPAGVANGQVIKLTGYGAPGVNGGPAGDLFITFVITPDAEFKRLGDDLYKGVDIDVFTAILGGDITVETLSGKVKLKIVPGTQNGAKARLKGKGVPVYKNEGQFGDLIITYTVKIPTDLNERQKLILSDIAKNWTP